MSTPEEIADCLERAADLIEVHGWSQGVWWAGSDGLCAMHAINRALGYPDSDTNSTVATCPLGAAAEQAMVAAGYQSSVWRPVSSAVASLWAWNDAKERTEFEVIDALRLAAKGLRPVELPDPHDHANAEALAERYAR